jgi:hypothetical protein
MTRCKAEPLLPPLIPESELELLPLELPLEVLLEVLPLELLLGLLPLELLLELPLELPLELLLELPLELPVELPLELPLDMTVELPLESPFGLALESPLESPLTVKLPTFFPAALHPETKAKCEISGSCRPGLGRSLEAYYPRSPDRRRCRHPTRPRRRDSQHIPPVPRRFGWCRGSRYLCKWSKQ